ncbi:hypothetical protein F7725_008891 [Dissostichus mawsoni]|uniref:Uncharacterized protein n=1 Tax=Dissostichus mawsoni TaxID=36200 RepID=A0A7J5Z5C3_DISMA|nr:hypothetical protein F7725_008891 [Dissostichus mawsoni]
MMDDRSPTNTPCVLDIQRAMVQDRLDVKDNAVDEIGGGEQGPSEAHGHHAHPERSTRHTGVYTGESFYSGMSITYLGIEVDDFPEADIAVHFRPSAEFLDEALLTHKGHRLI